MKNNSALTPRRSAQIYTILSDRLELPPGSQFTVTPGAVKAGHLALLSIGGQLTVGRWCPDLAGSDCICQPGLMITVVGPVQVRVIGPIALAE